MTPNVVYFHGDCADGFGAAWAHWTYRNDYKFDYRPANYGPDFKVEDLDQLVFLDIVPNRVQLLRMADRAGSILIIDHHRSNEFVVKNLPPNVTVRFDTSHSAAFLTWAYLDRGFFPDGWYPVPTLLKYVEDRDMWWNQLPQTTEVNAAIRSYPFEFGLWDSWMEEGPEVWVPRMTTEGLAALRVERRIYRKSLERVQHIYLGGVRIPVINNYVDVSAATAELMTQEKVSVAGYYFDRGDGFRQWGLRGDGSIDVSGLAKLMGGGGHFSAAGFTTGIRGHFGID